MKHLTMAMVERTLAANSKSAHQVKLQHVGVLRGTQEILSVSRVLEQFAARCGQPVAVEWMAYFLSQHRCAWKVPCLIFLGRCRMNPENLRAEELSAAVLLFEYRILGFRTSVFSSVETSSFRSVIAPVAERASAAALASQAFLRQGAQIVIATYNDATQLLPTPRLREETAPPFRWALLRRPVAKTLILESTYAATVTKLGKSTRFDLGNYRRRQLLKMAYNFLPDARGMLSERDLQIINSKCLNPAPFSLFKRRYESACNLPGGFLLGLRGPGGEWIGLIGGLRQGTATILHWQINIVDHEKAFIAAAFRSYFIECEIARGARTLTFYGGTPHTMQRSCVQEQDTDLILCRETWRASLLVQLARCVGAVQSIFGRRVSFVAETLRAASPHWTKCALDSLAEPSVQERRCEPAPHF